MAETVDRLIVDARFTLERHILNAAIPVVGLPILDSASQYLDNPKEPPTVQLESLGQLGAPAGGKLPWMRVTVRYYNRRQVSIGNVPGSRRDHFGAVLVQVFLRGGERDPTYAVQGDLIVQQVIRHYERQRIIMKEAPRALFGLGDSDIPAFPGDPSDVVMLVGTDRDGGVDPAQPDFTRTLVTIPFTFEEVA